jgi:hypothetical protein
MLYPTDEVNFLTYRYLVKSSDERIKTFNIGIPTIEERQTFTGRVKEFFRDQDELPPHKLAPKVLLGKALQKMKRNLHPSGVQTRPSALLLKP